MHRPLKPADYTVILEAIEYQGRKVKSPCCFVGHHLGKPCRITVECPEKLMPVVVLVPVPDSRVVSRTFPALPSSVTAGVEQKLQRLASIANEGGYYLILCKNRKERLRHRVSSGIHRNCLRGKFAFEHLFNNQFHALCLLIKFDDSERQHHAVTIIEIARLQTGIDQCPCRCDH